MANLSGFHTICAGTQLYFLLHPRKTIFRSKELICFYQKQAMLSVITDIHMYVMCAYMSTYFN